MRGTVHSQEPHGSYYSPVFLYASGKPLPKRVIRDPIMGKGNLGTEADLIYAGPCARAKSPPLRRAPRSNSRDPIRGHGDLGEEHDPFQRTAKVRRVNGTHQSRAVPISERDPVRCTGDLGPELDHLNRSPKVNRKAGKARPSQDPHRDPILGQGAIECYDKFRHGPERSRSSPRSQQARRDPIKGEGDIEEFDAITNGPLRVRLSRAPKPDTARGRASRDTPDSVSTLHSSNGRTPSSNRVQRDPIKGLGDFSTETKVRGRKQGGPRPSSGGRNPISGSTDIENQPPCGQHHKRHAGRATDSNPILGSGEDLKTYDITRESKARTPRPKSALMCSNPLSGENCQTFDMHTNMKTKSRGVFGSREHDSRNPLTGENCDAFVLGRQMITKRQFGQNRVPCNPLTGENCNTYVYNGRTSRGSSEKSSRRQSTVDLIR